MYDEDAELTRRAADHDFMKKLATAGGGQFLRAEKMVEFLDKLQAQPRDPKQNRGDVWPQLGVERDVAVSGSSISSLFVGLISGEWFPYRRRRWGWV